MEKRNCALFSADPPVSSTNKTDRYDIAEILLKVALNTIKQTKNKIMLPSLTVVVVSRKDNLVFDTSCVNFIDG
jgi:hypothetical protein